MTRQEALDLYRPIRAAVQRILADAPNACSKADLKRAAKSLGLIVDDQIAISDDDDELNMLMDVALFERNQRGNRTFDRYLSAAELSAEDAAVAQRLAGAFFTALHVEGPHEAAGLWVTDLLNGKRKFWLLDEGLSQSAEPGLALFMRLFDAGPFHAGLGIVVPCSEKETRTLVSAERPRDHLPNTPRLAPFIYEQEIRSRELAAIGPGDIAELLKSFM